MDILIVVIIVGGAIAFTAKSFIKIYKGEKNCGGCSGCACSSVDSCEINNNPEKSSQ
jgi:hypothetical protein